MIRCVKQTIFEPPTGNCLAACVASLFNRPLWTVPNFAALDCWYQSGCQWKRRSTTEIPRWWTSMGDFARSEGWRVLQLSNLARGTWAGHFTRGDVGIATVGKGNNDHCVLADLVTGEVVWDPHPQGWQEGHQLAHDDVHDWILFLALK